MAVNELFRFKDCFPRPLLKDLQLIGSAVRNEFTHSHIYAPSSNSLVILCDSVFY